VKKSYPFLPGLLLFPLGAIFVVAPVSKLIWATVGLLFLLKLGALIRNIQNSQPLPSGLGWLLYLFFWPGMRPESFCRGPSAKEAVGDRFVTGFLFFTGGILIQLALFFVWDDLNCDLGAYLGLLSFFLLVHLGFSEILFSLVRTSGWPVEPLFQSPLRSSSLREFWGQRWNLAFVDMNKRLFLPLFPKNGNKSFTVFGIFIFSGLLHEVGISYPAKGGWGGPFFYFVLQGFLTWVEPTIPFLKSRESLKKLWIWASLLIPLPFLFPSPFLNSFIIPYFEFGHKALRAMSTKEILYWLVLTCGAGHLLILMASFQVPGKLGWKNEFSRLGRFNQKIFWTYGGYIVFCIVAFALVDLLNTRSLLEINSSSFAISLFVALFWTVRIIVDFSYFKHVDWPQGDIFVIGHTCLTALFSWLALTHWGLVVWQVLRPGV